MLGVWGTFCIYIYSTGAKDWVTLGLPSTLMYVHEKARGGSAVSKMEV